MPALGKLGSADVPAATDHLLAGPLDEVGIVNINLCNRSAGPVKVRIAIGAGGAPAAADYIEYDTVLQAGKPLERTGFVVAAGEKIWVRSDLVGVSARAHAIAAA